MPRTTATVIETCIDFPALFNRIMNEHKIHSVLQMLLPGMAANRLNFKNRKQASTVDHVVKVVYKGNVEASSC